MKNEVSVFALMQRMICDFVDHYLGLAGALSSTGDGAYITRALLYRQLAKYCTEQATYFDECVAEFAPPSLVVTAEQPKAEAKLSTKGGEMNYG